MGECPGVCVPDPVRAEGRHFVVLLRLLQTRCMGRCVTQGIFWRPFVMCSDWRLIVSCVSRDSLLVSCALSWILCGSLLNCDNV